MITRLHGDRQVAAEVDEYIHLGEAVRPARAARGTLRVELLHDHTALLVPLAPRASRLEEEALDVAAHEGVPWDGEGKGLDESLEGKHLPWRHTRAYVQFSRLQRSGVITRRP